MITHNSMFSLKFTFSQRSELVFSKEFLISQTIKLVNWQTIHKVYIGTNQVEIAHGGNQGTAMLIDE